jgi:formamidopyrimidine-DNA glycosylase
MPELPEVETVRRGLEPAMVGARIEKVELRRKDIRFPFPPRFRERLTGRRIEALERRAKYLLFRLDSGETLIGHLGMSGSFRIETAFVGEFHHPRSKDPKHDHLVLHLDTAKTVTYNDPRRFGFFDLAATGALQSHPRLVGLGAEPLAPDFDARRLAELFAGLRAPLKSALLDQRKIAGLGNIYACEALWRAKLSPLRPAGILAAFPSPHRASIGTPVSRRTMAGEGSGVRGATPAARALAKAIHSVLEEAIEAGGSTLRDHRRADGGLGYFQHTFAVYDREGLPCLRPRCGGTIARLTQGGRSTFYCPKCQK